MNTASDQLTPQRSSSQSETLNQDRINKNQQKSTKINKNQASDATKKPQAAKESTPACDYECSTLFKSFKPLTKFDTVQLFRLLAIKITW